VRKNPIPKTVRDYALKHQINVRYEETPGGTVYTILDRNGKAIKYFQTASGTLSYMRRMAVARVRKPNKRKSNPRGVVIYKSITRIEGTKGQDSHYPGQKFYHNFKRPYPEMVGLPDGSLLIRKR
jgi:hypothetical protein